MWLREDIFKKGQKGCSNKSKSMGSVRKLTRGGMLVSTSREPQVWASHPRIAPKVSGMIKANSDYSPPSFPCASHIPTHLAT